MIINDMENKIHKAARWNAIAEISSKLIVPITNMILARLLVPEIFGIIATISMIISFSDMLSDAGFQKYLIQAEFLTEKEFNKHATVAFWSNIAISITLTFIIITARREISSLIGNSGHETALAVASLQIIVSSFSSIQFAILKHKLSFKAIFYSKLVGIITPFLITIPLAIIGYGYWSLIIGSLSTQVFTFVVLLFQVNWRPGLYFNFKILKSMLVFSMWAFLESFSVWLSAWVDIFIIGSLFSNYYTGLYRTSLNLVNSIIAVIVAVIIPVLYSALSRAKNDITFFKEIFFQLQKTTAYITFPLSLGLFMYRDLATQLFLGNSWSEASFIIGIWSITSGVKLVLSDMNNECFRASGKPKIAFFIQFSHIFFLIPACYIGAKNGFENLVVTRTLIRFQLIITSIIAMHLYMKITILEIFKNIVKPLIFTILMGILLVVLNLLPDLLGYSILSILLGGIFYVLLVFKFAIKDLHIIINIFISRKSNKEIS